MENHIHTMFLFFQELSKDHPAKNEPIRNREMQLDSIRIS